MALIVLSDRLRQRLEDLGSNVWADASVLERVRGEAQKGLLTEAEALQRLMVYELRLTMKMSPGLSEPRSDRHRSDIWQGDALRAFISHRDTHRDQALALAEALGRYRISSFVAHRSIEATNEWRQATRAGLGSMDAMVAFVTDDFHMSAWTMQEVGYALGKGIPCVSIMLETSKPPGFLEPHQSLRGALDHPDRYAPELAALLADASGRRSRIQHALIDALRDATTVQQARHHFASLRAFGVRLDGAEVSHLLDAINGNDVLRRAFLQKDKDVQKVIAFLRDSSDQAFERIGDDLVSSRSAGRG